MIAQPQPDLTEIQKSAVAIIGEGQGRIIEIRAPETPNGTWSGYYNRRGPLVQDVFDLSSKMDVPKVYWTIQEIDPSLLNPEKENSVESHVQQVTADERAIKYRWLPLDCDPVRSGKISSTDVEKASALETAKSIRAFLLDSGITTIFADSGNGYHILVRLDIENKNGAKELIERTLKAFNARWGNQAVAIDTKVSNPSRILTIYGTVARKGEHSDERPWRTSRLIDTPLNLTVLTREHLMILLDDVTRGVSSEKMVLTQEVKRPPTVVGDIIPHGEHDNELHRIAGRLRYDGLEEQAIYTALVEVVEKRCEGYGSDYLEMCRKHAHNICKKPVGKDDRVLSGGVPVGTQTVTPIKVAPVAECPFSFEDDSAELKVSDPHKSYAMTEEEIAAQDELEYPVYKLHPTPGPDFDEKHLYGVLGYIAKKMCKHSEAHLATVYLNLLVSFGSMMGRCAYFNLDNTKHYTNEFLACVGSSSKARKGLASDVASGLISVVDANWFNNRNVSGFATSQAVLSLIKDDATFQKLDHKTGLYKTITQPGILDKRLCIREGELSNVFKLIADSQQRAGELVRNLWDSKAATNVVAGKSADGEHNSLICKEPHVSIIGSSTPSLVKSTLPPGASKSGDGNRFIWCYTKRTQLCPFGGPPIDWQPECITYDGDTVNLITYLCGAIADAKNKRLMPITSGARKYWSCLYQRLETDTRTDFLGGMTSRAAGHIRRLAMIFCLIDREDVISRDHLEAAEAIWNYSQDSARYIFMAMGLDGAKILKGAHAAMPNGITATDVHSQFNHNKPAQWIKMQLDDLVEGGFLVRTKELRSGINTVRDYEAEVYRFRKW